MSTTALVLIGDPVQPRPVPDELKAVYVSDCGSVRACRVLSSSAHRVQVEYARPFLGLARFLLDRQALLRGEPVIRNDPLAPAPKRRMRGLRRRALAFFADPKLAEAYRYVGTDLAEESRRLASEIGRLRIKATAIRVAGGRVHGARQCWRTCATWWI